jgi:hypothetical protein
MLRAEKPTKKAKATAATVADLDRKIVQLGIDHDEGLIDRREWLDRRAKLVERLEEARAELVPSSKPTELLRQFEGVSVEDRWDGLELDQRRAVLRLLIEKVVIHPAPVHGRAHAQAIAALDLPEDTTAEELAAEVLDRRVEPIWRV